MFLDLAGARRRVRWEPRKTKPAGPAPYALDLEELRSWLETQVAALKLVELVAAVIALIARMRAIWSSPSAWLI